MATFLETLTVPAGTPLDTPVQQELIITPGVALVARLYVPPGPRGELYLRLLHRGVQLAPARAGTWWRLDNITVSYPLDVQVSSGDNFFYLQGASPSASFGHTVDFEVVTDPSLTQSAANQPPNIISRLASLFG